jgi:hypothetical protein
MMRDLAECFAAKYHVEAELYDRSLPGEWREDEPEVWMPRSDVVGASLRYASNAKRVIRDDAEAAGVPPQAFHEACVRIGQQGWSFARLQALAAEVTTTEGLK